ncbi:DUF4350 domain-containing protein [Nonlabens ponticola]|nr:DUF4350 domain-containing protein [Nonlabens ponticola]
MDKRTKFILYAMLVVLIGLVVLESTRPKPVNWRPSYTSGDKIPLGGYVFYDNLDEMFPDAQVKAIDQVPIDFLRENIDLTDANYIFLNDYLVFDEVETDYLMEFAARGNKVFISAGSAFGAMADTLKLETNSGSFYSYGAEDTLRTRLVNEKFKDRSYVYSREGSYRYFESYDTLNSKVLGEVLAFNPQSTYLEELIMGDSDDEEELDREDWTDEEKEEQEEAEQSFEEMQLAELKTRKTPQVNFVETRVGDGAIYYHLNPIAFSNYYMLNGKENYVAEAMSYLNDGDVYFDDYGKSGRKVIQSPVRFILSDSALSAAYYLAIVAILLYIIFVSKREQRIVPVVKPLENATVDFTKTIGDLYFESGDYDAIVDKKILFFLENIRSRYYLNTQELNDVFMNRLAVKSGKSVKQTADIINYIKLLKSKSINYEHELTQLTRRIEAFNS